MKRYRFRLQQVLGVRQVEEERRKADLAAARRQLAGAEAEVSAQLVRYEATPALPGALPAQLFLSARFLHEAVAHSVVAAGVARADARDAAERSRIDWSEAAQRVAALERLDERRRAEHTLAAQQEADREVDDIVTGRFGRSTQGDRR